MRLRVIMTLAVLVMLPSAASAGAFKYYGPHIGFAQDPDQTVIGGQLQMNGVAPRMAFVPGVDYGFNDVSSVLTLNGDLHYNLTYETTWQPYVGMGVGVDLRSTTTTRESRRQDTGNDLNPSGHLIVGAAIRNHSGGRFFTELRLGLGDSAGLKMLAGINVRSR